MPGPTARLDKDTRLQLFRFCCSMAWADCEVQDEERIYLTDLVHRLELDEAQRAQAEAWYLTPPPLDELDPNVVPADSRQLFLDECRAIIEADGRVDDDEATFYITFERILFPERDPDNVF